MFPYSDVFSYNWKSQYNSHIVCDTGRALIVKTYFHHPLGGGGGLAWFFFFVFLALNDIKKTKKKPGSDHGLAPTRLLQAITWTTMLVHLTDTYMRHTASMSETNHI